MDKAQKFRTAYDGERVKVETIFKKPSMAVQYEAENCDINRIMAKYMKTGLITHVNRYQGIYTDVSSSQTYQEAMHTIINAQEAFDSLPSNIRDRFANDPAKFLAFVHDENNIEEMKKLGLMAEKVEPVIPVVRIAKEEGGTVDT